jgi:hypothetical protein
MHGLALLPLMFSMQQVEISRHLAIWVVAVSGWVVVGV